MIWIIALLIIISLILLSQYRVLGSLFLALTIVAASLFFIFEIIEQRRAVSRILADEVIIYDERLDQRTRRSFSFQGRLQNKSEEYSIIGFDVLIKIKDCESKECIVVAQETDFIRLNIPPNQARDFNQNIYIYSDFEIKHEFDWEYEIQSVRGK